MSILPHHTSDPQCPLCDYKLTQAHDVLRDWFNTHVKPQYPDAHVSWSYRNKQDQDRCLAENKTRLEFPMSKHNQIPSLAIDLFEIDQAGHGVWNPKFFVALNEYNEGNGFPIGWGGRWRSLGDGDHFELMLHTQELLKSV